MQEGFKKNCFSSFFISEQFSVILYCLKKTFSFKTSSIVFLIETVVSENIFQIYAKNLGGQLYWCRNPKYPEKTTNLSQITDKHYHIMLHWVHLAWAGFELTTLVVIGTDSIGSYKSNCHMITTMTAPVSYKDSVIKADKV